MFIKIMLFPSVGGYMLNFISKRRRLYVKSHRRYNFFKFVFPIIRMGAIRYSCPVRLVSTYILPAKDIRLWGKFQPDSFKTERLSLCRKHADHEYIHFMGSETSLSLFHKLLTEIIILSARYKNVISKLRRLYVQNTDPAGSDLYTTCK